MPNTAIKMFIVNSLNATCKNLASRTGAEFGRIEEKLGKCYYLTEWTENERMLWKIENKWTNFIFFESSKNGHNMRLRGGFIVFLSISTSASSFHGTIFGFFEKNKISYFILNFWNHSIIFCSLSWMKALA